MLINYIFNVLFGVIQAYMILLGVFALMSWFPGAYQTLLGQWVRYFVDPLLKPFRRLNLRFGILDITVLVAFAALNFVRYLLWQIYMMLLLW